MSRPLRIEFPNAWFHVMNRGRSAEKIFHDEKDCETFIELLKETSEAWDIRIAAYCLMPNHYHLLVQTPNANLSRSMRHINGIYTQRFNRRHGSDGPLFRGRYKSILVSPDSYLLQLARYIHRNPVKAGIAASLDAYPWSSHKGYLSISKKWNWIYKEFVYLLLTEDKTEWIKTYRKFVAIEEDDDVSNVIEGKKWPSIWGGKGFTDWVKGQYYSLKTNDEIPQARELAPEPSLIIREVCRFYKKTADDLYKSKRGEFNEPRNVAVFLMRKLRRESLREIGIQFRMDKYSSVSSMIIRVKRQMRKDRGLRQRLEKLHQSIIKSQRQI